LFRELPRIRTRSLCVHPPPMIRLASQNAPFFQPALVTPIPRQGSVHSPLNAVYAIASSLHPLSPLPLLALFLPFPSPVPCQTCDSLLLWIWEQGKPKKPPLNESLLWQVCRPGSYLAMFWLALALAARRFFDLSLSCG